MNIPDWMLRHLFSWSLRLHDDEREQVRSAIETWLMDPENLAEVEAQNLDWYQVQRRAEG